MGEVKAAASHGTGKYFGYRELSVEFPQSPRREPESLAT